MALHTLPRFFIPSLLVSTTCLLAVANPAHAQGTEGFIADPITSEVFDAMIDRLDLEYADRLRAEAAHEEYKLRYFALRENEIEDLLMSMYKMQSMFGNTMPGRDVIADLLRQRETVVTRCEAVDRDLFSALQDIVPQEKATDLARARRQRERDTYDIDAVGGPFAGGGIDLVDILYEIDLDQQTWDAIEPVVTEYELSSNAALESLHDKTMDMFVAMFEVLEEMGMDSFQPDFEDMEKMEEFGRMMQEAMDRVSKDVQQAAERARTIDDQSRTLITRMLPADKAARFEDEYLHRAHPNVYNDMESPERLIQGALRMDEVTADQKSQIEAIASRWEQAYEVFQQKLIALEEEQREVAAEFDMSGESWQQHWQRQQEVQAERSQLNQQTREDILRTLGEDISSRVANLQGPMHLTSEDGMHMAVEIAEGVATAIVEGEGGVQVGTSDVTVSLRGADPMLPGAISKVEFAAYLDRMGLSSDQRTLAEDFHAGYREAYEKLTANEIQELVVKPQQELWQGSGNQDDAAAAGRRLSEGRTRAFELIMGLEDELFLDLELVLDAAQRALLPEIRTARERVVYDMGDVTFTGMDRDWVDLGQLVLDLRLSPDQMQAMHDTLAAYEADVVPIVRALYDNLRATEAVQLEAQRTMMRLMSEGTGDRNEAWVEYNRLMEPYQTKLADLQKQRGEVEQAARDSFMAALPPDKAAQFENRYNRSSYPEIFPDREDAEPSILAAFELRDLSPQQVQEIALIDDDHRRRYNELCDEMMALSDASDSNMPQFLGGQPDFEAMAEWQRRQSRMGVLKYQRSEWNATTRRTLRAALTEEQAQQIRGLGVEADAAE